MKTNEKEKALIAILDSIAAEERAIAGLIDAETKKLNAVIERIKIDACPQDLKLILEIQKSIIELMKQVCCVEENLKRKAELAIGALKELK